MAGAVKRKPVGPEPKLTPQLAELFLNTIRQTGNFRAASDKCAVAAGTVYRWCQEGATEKVGHPKRDLSDAIARARADYHAICFARHHQLSVGGVLQLPHMDKFGNPVRHDCKRLHGGEPCEASGQIVFTEKVVMPDIRGLQFEIERFDPRNKAAEETPAPAGQDLNSAEAIAEAAKYFDLYREGVQILIDLGCPPRQLLESSKDIETTATKPKEKHD